MINQNISSKKKSTSLQNRFFLFLFSLMFFLQPLAAQPIKLGAERFDQYLPYLKNKKIGIVANQTTLVGKIHLVDSLLSLKVNLVRILCPEHGFRGDIADGGAVNNESDKKTGLPLISIYTQTKKPTPADLKDLDIVIFDLQDVGLRFYTTIMSLHYVMEACAENNVEVLVLDRPNPHGFYMDGPKLDTAFKSDVGMHPIPVVHGMTMAEYAQMINGEKWLKKGIQCNLKVIPCANYTHDSLYSLPVRPSPNLPNMTAIMLYPSVCLFEGTVFSLGRGTDFPFQVFGNPNFKNHEFSFTPKPRQESTNPPQNGLKCFGVDLRNYDLGKIIKGKKIDLQWLLYAYNGFEDKKNFFSNYIEKLWGSRKLREQVLSGMNESEIRKTWQKDIEEFKPLRSKYLLYKDFNN